MTHKFLFSSALGLGLMSASVNAATVTVGGLVLPPLMDENGTNPLPDGSIVQVGYLLGLSPSVDLDTPGGFALLDWNSFVPLTGVGSPNSSGINDTRVSSIFGSGTFFGDGLEFESGDGGDFGTPTGIPVRLAVRVFDSTTGVNALFNTFTSSGDSFILEDPSALDPNAGRGDFSINDVSDSGLFWQGTPFQTTVAIPEPSTSLSALLGLTLLAGSRRRK